MSDFRFKNIRSIPIELHHQMIKAAIDTQTSYDWLLDIFESGFAAGVESMNKPKNTITDSDVVFERQAINEDYGENKND